VRVRALLLHEGPAVVLPALRFGRLEVDFFLVASSHVADPQVAGLPVELEPPRVAKAVGPDLSPGPSPVREGVVRRDPIGLGAQRARVYAEQLGEQDAEVLTVPHGVALAPPVAHADVEIAIRA